jgi:hypothetical protein
MDSGLHLFVGWDLLRIILYVCSHYYYYFKSGGSSVGIATCYGMDDQGAGIRVL